MLALVIMALVGFSKNEKQISIELFVVNSFRPGDQAPQLARQKLAKIVTPKARSARRRLWHGI
jgi:hypothetical protein